MKKLMVALLTLCYIVLLVAIAFTIHNSGYSWPVSFLLSLGTIIVAALIVVFAEFIKWLLD